MSKNVIEERKSPSDVERTVRILAPKGSPVEKQIGAVNLAAELYQSKQESGLMATKCW